MSFVYDKPSSIDGACSGLLLLNILVGNNNQYMKKSIAIFLILFIVMDHLEAQVEPGAGAWKTWFITSGKDYRLPAPPSNKDELSQVISIQKDLDATGKEEIQYWNAGPPGYRWRELLSHIWVVDTSANGALSNMLLGTATYDATIIAWDTKYAYKRPRPFAADNRIKSFILNPESPSYPCEHSVAAGVAVTVIGHFYPHLKDSLNRMAQRLIASRIAAGAAFPSDTRAGFELGKKIAAIEIERTKDFTSKTAWDGKVPQEPGHWKGKWALLPTAGKSKTVVLTSSSQYRPGPPPDFSKDMAELKSFKQTFRSQSNAFLYANMTDDLLTRKIFENNLHLNPPRAARIYAATAVAAYDGFVACWDAKYTYWGIRPDQYDSTYKPLLPTPPFPGYPSGHAMMGGANCVVYAYFFPADKAVFEKRCKDGAESRFHAGIHFRTDNDTGVELGKRVGAAIVERLKQDGADANR